VDDLSVRIGMRGVLGVMAELRMIRQRKRGRRLAPALSTSSRWVRADESGLFRPFKEIGDHVEIGERLGVIADPYGEKESELTAPSAGIIIGRANIPAVNQGDALFHIARVENAPQLGARYDDLGKELGGTMLDEDEIL
jgi:uncharacterized protein